MKLQFLLRRSSQNGQGPAGQEASEKLRNEILKWMSKSCQVDVSNMLRSLERQLLKESLESQVKSADLALFIQIMPEISAAPYQPEKGQLPVLASTQLTVTQKSLGVSAGTEGFLCDEHHLSGKGHCKVFNEINRIYSDFCCGFFQQARWNSFIAGWASLWEAELVEPEVCNVITASHRKEKQKSIKKVLLFPCSVKLLRYNVLSCSTNDIFSASSDFPKETIYIRPSHFPLALFPSSAACTLMPLNIGKGNTFYINHQFKQPETWPKVVYLCS